MVIVWALLLAHRFLRLWEVKVSTVPSPQPPHHETSSSVTGPQTWHCEQPRFGRGAAIKLITRSKLGNGSFRVTERSQLGHNDRSVPPI